MYKVNVNNTLLIVASGVYLHEGDIYYESIEPFDPNRTVTSTKLNLEGVDFITVDGDLFYTKEDGVVYDPSYKKPAYREPMIGSTLTPRNPMYERPAPKSKESKWDGVPAPKWGDKE